MTAADQRIGLRAEEATAGWLESSGWRIVARRHRTPWGELDIVAVDPRGTLVGVEVKLRRHARSGSGPESVDGRRLRRLTAALAGFAARAAWRGRQLRLDLVVLAPGPAETRWRLRHYRDIGGW